MADFAPLRLPQITSFGGPQGRYASRFNQSAPGAGQAIDNLAKAFLSGPTPEQQDATVALAEDRRSQADVRKAQLDEIAQKLTATKQAAQDRASLPADYVSMKFGLPGEQTIAHLTGAQVPPLTPNDDEGNPMPSAPSPRPEGLTPDKESVIRSTLANLRLQGGLTGKTDLPQFMQGMAQTPVAEGAQTAQTPGDMGRLARLAGAIAGKGAYTEGAAGDVFDKYGGGVDQTTPLAQGHLGLLGAQTGEKKAAAGKEQAQAGLAGAQTAKVKTETVPAVDVSVPGHEGTTIKVPGAAVGREYAKAQVAAGGGDVPGGAGSTMLQDRDTGAKYAVNTKTGKAFQAGDDGSWTEVPINKVPANAMKVGSGAAGQSGREAVFTQRVLTSANEAAKDLANVVNLPISASTGIFGGRKQGPGIFDATKEVLANKLTGQEAQSYNVMATGFQRSLATIEASGLMPSGSLTHQMDTVLAKEGDTVLTKLQKLAQTRQIVDAGLEVQEASPRVSATEKTKIQGIRDALAQAVPFTHSDLLKLQAEQERNPNITLTDILKSKPRAAAPAQGAAPPAGIKFLGFE
jgi:hypothetical protein